MAQRKAFPLRLDPAVYEALQRWAGAELRSLNGQIEWVLRQAAAEKGYLKREGEDGSRAKADEGLHPNG